MFSHPCQATRFTLARWRMVTCNKFNGSEQPKKLSSDRRSAASLGTGDPAAPKKVAMYLYATKRMQNELRAALCGGKEATLRPGETRHTLTVEWRDSTTHVLS